MLGSGAPRINVGLVGCGYWGANLCRVLAGSTAFRLKWLCDANQAALDRVASLGVQAETTNDLDVVLGDPEIDAVVVATPVGTHSEVGMAVLRHGKHCFIEKPLAHSVAAAEELCAEATLAQCILMVGHTFLYNAAVRKVKEILATGDLGDVLYIVCQRLNLGVVRSDVDALWNLAPHDISMLLYWLERPVESASAVGHSFLQKDVADVVFADLSFAGKVGAHIHVSWLDPAKVRRATIVGSRKMLVFDDLLPDARISILDKGVDLASTGSKKGAFGTYADHKLMVRSGDVWVPRVDVPEPLRAEMEEFASCIVEDRRPLSDGANGLEVVRVLERLTAAMGVLQR